MADTASEICDNFVAPTIGETTPDLFKIHDNATWVGFILCLFATEITFLITSLSELRNREAPVTSPLSYLARSVSPIPPSALFPAKTPLANGLYGINPTPFSKHKGIISRSSSRWIRLYKFCMAIGRT